jgi:hypothetical protein
MDTPETGLLLVTFIDMLPFWPYHGIFSPVWW